MVVITYLKRHLALSLTLGVLLLVGTFMYITLINNPVNAQEVSEEIRECECVDDEFVLVDIKGAVKKPGVYKLNKNSIVNDVIDAAGGLKSSATTDDINLSKSIYNEMVIYISTKSELKEKQNSSNNVPSIVENDNSDICNVGSKVNINSASVDDLMTLKGVGESKALKIIEYRNTNGLFKSIEDIKNVSGIGETFYEKIKDYITV